MPYTWRSWVQSEALCGQVADEGPEERSGPLQHTASQHQSPVSGLQTRLSTCWFLRSWASSSSMCWGVGTFGVHCSLQRPLTSFLRCGHWGGGDEGADGCGRSCGGRSETTEGSMGRILFCPGPHTTVQPFRQPEVPCFLCSSLVPPEGGRQCHRLLPPASLLLNL